MKTKLLLPLMVSLSTLLLLGCPNPVTPPADPNFSAYLGVLRYVPTGSFQRDASATNISVITQPYLMSQHEITRAQFLAIMGTDPSDTPFSNGSSDPVQKVNWYHAIAFCNKLSIAEGLTPVYSVTVEGTPVNWRTLTYASIPIPDNLSNSDNWDAATVNWTNNGYRLPTEMEWMWAAMGAPADGQEGGTNTTGYAKAFAGSTGSNVIGDYAWYLPNGSFKTHPAGIKLDNELGLHDMSGNVWECCWDWLGTVPPGTLIDYRGAASGTHRVIRGGSWNDDAPDCTVAHRYTLNPVFQARVYGFRVVRPDLVNAPPTVVNIKAIPGVKAPAFGATPVTTITETAQYTGTVSWNGTPTTFAASTVYTATITLTAKAGFKLTGVTANFFTVAGATSDTNPVNSGVVTAVFPATGDGSYTSVNIGVLPYVPAGRFQRDAGSANISVITQVYRMSQHEITREQFAAVLTTDPSNTTYSSGISDPVQMTNWYHAIAFCNKLSLAEGLIPVYSVTIGGTPVNWSTLTYADIPTTSNADWDAATASWTNNGYRLPTEMEWMWAAMGAPADGQGGGTNTTGYAKAFAGSTGSNAIGDYAVFGYNGSQIGRTTTERSNPVGSKLANELGLYDMSGNVWEWCWDWQDDPYPSGIQTDYRGAASGTIRVARGSSWAFNAAVFIVANRGGGNPNVQNGTLGFRVVRP